MATDPKQATDPKHSNVLDLDVFTDRLQVKASGHLFELRNLDEFAPIELHRISSKGRRLDTLMRKAELTPLTSTEEAELTSLPNEVCTKVVAVGVEHQAKLDDRQRWAICQAFMKPRPTAQMPTSAAGPTPSAAKRRTGAR